MDFDTTITLLLNGSQNIYLDAFAMLATKTWVWIGFYVALLYVVFREHDMRHFFAIIVGILLFGQEEYVRSEVELLNLHEQP